MAHATFEDYTGTGWPTDGTTQTGNYPATVNADDLLLFVGVCDGSTDTVSIPTDTFGGTWTSLVTIAQVTVAWKKAIGNEDGGTYDVTIPTAEGGAGQIIRYSGMDWAKGDPESGTANTGSATATWPINSFTASFSVSEDNTAIAVAGGQDDDATVSTWPVGYGNLNETVSGASGTGGGVAFSDKQLSSNTDSPSDYLMSTSDTFGTLLVIIPQAAAAGGFIPYPNPRYSMAGGMQPMSGGI